MSEDQIGAWVTAARGGNLDGLGQLLESFRPYLLAVAHKEIRGRLRAKCA